MKSSLKIRATNLGYNQVPVSIETFVKDKYYLGNILNSMLYPYWLEKLKQLYPDPLTTSSNIVVLNGGIGTGKSTFAKICALYEIYRLSCKEFQSKFDLVFLDSFDENRNNDLEITKDWIHRSPYFVNTSHEFKSLINFYHKNFNSIITEDKEDEGEIVQYNITYTDYSPHDLVKEKLKRILETDNIVFLEVISGEETPYITELLKEYKESLMLINDPLWEVKKHLGIFKLEKEEDSRSYFHVLVNYEDLNKSEIYEKDLPKDIDEENSISIPSEFLDAFKYDIKLALNHIAGIPRINL